MSQQVAYNQSIITKTFIFIIIIKSTIDSVW